MTCFFPLNQDGFNALHVACEKGNPGIMKALLQASVKQEKFSQWKGLPSDLHIALHARTNKVATKSTRVPIS